ncbi:hypothetical protein M2352_000814 [Azospirillum fermentarium]|uniref:hypothetical protein n=1 Tax=Azospirillum fermentarium TaxID=1233114 RepID=UPI002225D529|nr:hypothetical protein [Azospirillum fermentarium]MCW2245223.1 hypothetical protein [Azospirillum fermentarium]
MRIRLAAPLVALAVAAGILTAGGTPALAADPPKTAPGSPLAKVAFPVQPFSLADDGTYAGFMADVAKSIKRTCGRVEAYGWEFPGATTAAEQLQVTAVVQSTMGNFEKVGYRLEEAADATLPDREMVAYTAVKDRTTLLLVWTPLTDSAMLLLCDASPAK